LKAKTIEPIEGCEMAFSFSFQDGVDAHGLVHRFDTSDADWSHQTSFDDVEIPILFIHFRGYYIQSKDLIITWMKKRKRIENKRDLDDAKRYGFYLRNHEQTQQTLREYQEREMQMAQNRAKSPVWFHFPCQRLDRRTTWNQFEKCGSYWGARITLVDEVATTTLFVPF
jgi:hypothetical protein